MFSEYLEDPSNHMKLQWNGDSKSILLGDILFDPENVLVGLQFVKGFLLKARTKYLYYDSGTLDIGIAEKYVPSSRRSVTRVIF